MKKQRDLPTGIRQRGPDVYEIRLYADGRNYSATVHGTLKQAKLKLAELRVQVNGGAYVKPVKLTVADFLQRWLESYSRSQTEATTHQRYTGIVNINIIPVLGAIPLSRIGPEDVLRAHAYWRTTPSPKTGRPLSERSLQQIHSVLHEALGHAVKWGYRANNPAAMVDRPKVTRREPTILNPAQLMAAIREMDPRFGGLIYAAAFTGLRMGELLGLRWADVDFVAGSLQVRQVRIKVGRVVSFKPVPKTAAGRRSIGLDEGLASVLSAEQRRCATDRIRVGSAYADLDLVFCGPFGEPLSEDAIRSELEKATVRAGVPRITPHGLRHTFASLNLAMGADMHHLSRTMGHSSIAVTVDIYGHLLNEAEQERARRFGAYVKANLGEIYAEREASDG